MRYLFLIIAIWLAVIILRHFYRRKISDQVKPAINTQTMVRCEHCGVHVPRSEARQQDQKWFCSSQHLQAYTDKHK